jgi:hypothetical protein
MDGKSLSVEQRFTMLAVSCNTKSNHSLASVWISFGIESSLERVKQLSQLHNESAKSMNEMTSESGRVYDQDGVSEVIPIFKKAVTICEHTKQLPWFCNKSCSDQKQFARCSHGFLKSYSVVCWQPESIEELCYLDWSLTGIQRNPISNCQRSSDNNGFVGTELKVLVKDDYFCMLISVWYDWNSEQLKDLLLICIF